MALARHPDAPAEILVAAAHHLDPVATKIELLSRASQLVPTDASIHMSLAELHEESGQPADAIRAWDRAGAIALGHPRPVLAPIRLLAQSGRGTEALARAAGMAEEARKKSDGLALGMASLAYKYAQSPKQAVVLAREAVAAREGDGRLVSELAVRLVEAGAQAEATRVLSELLVCGARGRTWHRHEIAARLSALVSGDALRQAVKEVGCQPIALQELTSLLTELD